MATILIVEDDIDTNEAVCEYLQEAGHNTVPAFDGDEAITLFSEQKFDLVVLDIMLPTVTGLVVLNSIRKTSQVPVLMLTAMEDEQINAATEQMRELEPAVHCQTDRQDEMGMLADNVNNLYQTLLSTIQTLEQEIEKVEAADIQKSNFLRAASHELKTPVTAVSVMLENMLLNVGKYKDRDTYLAKCKGLTDQLAQMIKEILDASRAEFAGEQEQTDFLIADAFESVMGPYQIIAKSKGITVNIELDESATVHLPRGMIEKAISNILANAVSYTKPGGMIDVSCKGRQLVVENECIPISPEHLAHIFEPFYRPDYGRDRAAGGNGLGLYLVSTILKSLDISYSFVPSQNINGMSFQISF